MSTPTFRGYITDALPELQGQNIIIKTVPDNIISVDDLARVGGQLLVQVLSQADTDLCWNHFVAQSPIEKSRYLFERVSQYRRELDRNAAELEEQRIMLHCLEPKINVVLRILTNIAMNKARSFDDPSARRYKARFLCTSEYLTEATRNYFSVAFSGDNPLDNMFKKSSHEVSLRSAAIIVQSLEHTACAAFSEIFEFITAVPIDEAAKLGEGTLSDL